MNRLQQNQRKRKGYAEVLLIVATFAILVTRLLRAPIDFFNDIRLAPLFMFGSGMTPYPHLPGSGPMANIMYPPLSFLSYAPALLFTSPAGAVRCAALLVQVFALAPVLVALLLGKNAVARAGHAFNTILLFAAFVFWAELSPVMTNIYSVHADAPAIAFAAMTCIFTVLALEAEGKSGRWAVAAGICAALGPWAKQLVLPAVAIPFLFFWLTGKRKCLGYFCLAASTTAAAALSVFHWLFDIRDLYFWLVTVPSRHPLKTVWSTALPDANLELLKENAVWLAIAIFFALPLFREGLRSEGRRAAMRREGWIVYLIAGVLMWPFSMLGYAHVGGAHNNLLFSTYFLMLSVMIKARNLMETLDTRIAARGFVTVFLTCISIPVAIDFSKNLLSPKRVLVNDMTIVHDYCRLHPGDVYFPMYPTAVFLAEGRINHYEFGIEDREFAGLPVDSRQFFAAFPAGIRYLAYDGTVPRSAVKYAEIEPNPIQLPELPGWSVYRMKSQGRQRK